MVESAEDIINCLNWTEHISQGLKQPSKKSHPTIQEQRLLTLITKHGGLRPEALSSLSGIPIQEVLATLTELELKGWLTVEPGNLYQTLMGDS